MPRLPLVLAAILASAGGVSAQAPVVYFDHAPGQSTTSYVNPSAGNGRWHGPIPPLATYSGEHACVHIENGNPLLYTYELTAKEEPAGSSDALKPIAAAIIALVPGAGAASAVAITAQSASDSEAVTAETAMALDSVAVRIAAVAQAAAELRRYRFESDRELRIADMRIRVAAELADVQQLHRVAVAELAKLAVVQKLAKTAALLRTVADRSLEDAVAVERELRAAADGFRPELCRRIGTSATTLTLTVKRRAELPAGVTAGRSVPDPVSFVVEPLSPSVFEVSAGAALAYVPARRGFRLEDGRVTRDGADRWDVALGVFATWRPRRSVPFWATLGVLDGATSEPDVLVGVTFKPLQMSAPAVNLGAGVLFARVPVDLRRGAQVGEPLPDGIAKLDDAVLEGRRLGFGVMLNLTGIKLPSSN